MQETVRTVWRCAGCGEQNTPEFDVCWNCGCSISGEPDPSFLSEEQIDLRELTADPGRTYLPYPPARYQLSLRFLFIVVTLIGILAAMTRYLPRTPYALAVLVALGALWMMAGLLLIGIVYLSSAAIGLFTCAKDTRSQAARADARDFDEPV